jgi:hypothetical protein
MIRSFAVVLLRGWTRRSSSAWPKTKGFATGGQRHDDSPRSSGHRGAEADAMTAARFLIGWTKAVGLVLAALAAEAAIGAAISEYIH